MGFRSSPTAETLDHAIGGGAGRRNERPPRNGNDVATGGPGFSFPVWQWNGAIYINANRTVSDSALDDARFIPNG